MKSWQRILYIPFVATALLLFAVTSLSRAQQSEPEATEVYLTFRYRGIVNVYITSYYRDNQFYLPVSELFNTLQIQHQVDQGALTISGTYLGDTNYTLDFDNQVARAGDTVIELQAEDFIIPGIDYFVKPALFEQLFGLKFTTNFNNLTLDLETDDKMPVVAQYEREQRRQQLDRDKPLYDRTFYPLRYDRDHGSIDGAFLDYNLSAVYSGGSPLFTFSNAIGAEVLAGDVQGNLFGAYSREQQSFTTSGLRWRYVQRDNPYFSSATVGQTNTGGFGRRGIRGIKISNKPVEPRLLFDRYVIDGNTIPQSEVELYLNNSLVDFQEADESGNYRFVVPLTYGSTNYSLRIYTPAGQAIERNQRIQVPFDYIPKGEVDYSISAGELSNPILGFTEGGYMADASVSAGLSNWLTAQATTEYLTKFHGSLPSFTGTLNARLFSNYLVSLNANTENFYRLSSSVVYSNGASWSLNYDYNPGNSRLYNVGGSRHQARLNLFTPFQIGTVPLNIRWTSNYQQNQASTLVRYRADLNTRLGRLNIRLGYQDQQSGALSLTSTSSSRVTNSYTYSMGRNIGIPGIFRGMFIRGQVSYLPGLEEFEEMEFQLSRDIMRTGRVQLTFGRNFLGEFNTLGLNVSIDFNHVRSNTSATSNGSTTSITQNVRGSVGYDPYGDQFLLTNRQQVGQAGTAVRLFVDNNNDGSYQPESDNLIKDPAVRLNRSGGRTRVKNGINYISQLLPYYQYDMEINKAALSNPLLVPETENFSIITDPNQYKPIEIPFYQSGVISGRVEQLQIQGRDTTRKELSGVRVYLESDYENAGSREPHSEEIRTFSDGSFYTYEVPPGKYNLFVDPNQLEFLNGISRPDTMKLEVEALPQGDFLEGLHFLVVSRADTIQSQIQPEISDNRSKSKEEKSHYQIQLISLNNYEDAVGALKTANRQLASDFGVWYNPYPNLFAIRTKPIDGIKKAIDQLLQIKNNSIYENPALVLRDEKNLRFSVQLGSFASAERAKHFIRETQETVDLELTYYQDAQDSLYKVFTKSVNSQADAKNKLDKLQQISRFENITIPGNTKLIFDGLDYDYEIRIKNIGNVEEVAIPVDFSEENVVNEPGMEMITFTNITTWREALSKQEKLKKLNPEANPIIILLGTLTE